MALSSGIHCEYIRRFNVDQPTYQEGWKHLLQEARHGFNFDGEIFGPGFRMKSGNQQQIVFHALTVLLGR